MTIQSDPDQDRKRRTLNLTLVGLVGQIGCVTLVIVLGSLGLGLWLDTSFKTKPLITLVLLVVSIPVSVLTMLYLARAAIRRIRPDAAPQKPGKEEEGVGRYPS